MPFNASPHAIPITTLKEDHVKKLLQVAIINMFQITILFIPHSGPFVKLCIVAFASKDNRVEIACLMLANVAISSTMIVF